MSGKRQTWVLRILVALAALLAAYLLYPYLTAALQAGMGAVMGLVLVLAYVLAAIALPLIFFALLKFAYSVFARPYLRLRRIHRLRERRYLREAARRGRFKVIVNPHRANSDQHQSPPAAEP
jgi:hypothetical protein